MHPLETVKTAGRELDDERKTAIRNAIHCMVQVWLRDPDADAVADALADNDILADDEADVRDVDHEYAMRLFSKIKFTIGDS